MFVNVLQRAHRKILSILRYLSTSYNVHVDEYHFCSHLFILVLVFTRQSSSAPRWEFRLTDLSTTLHSQTYLAGADYQVISKRYQQTCRNRVVPWSVLASWCQGLCLTTSVEGEKLPKTQFWNETWCVTWMDYNWCDSNCWYWIVTFLLDQSHITVNPRSSLWEKHNG